LSRLGTPDSRIQLELPDLLEVVESLKAGPEARDPAFPFVLCAGERRSFTANTILRDPNWRRSDSDGAMRMSPSDAVKFGVESGDAMRLTTPHGSALVHVEVNEMMREGHISLPNGTGLKNMDDFNDTVKRGIAPNELTSADDRDPFVGTPWHKNVPARLEPVRVEIAVG